MTKLTDQQAAQKRIDELTKKIQEYKARPTPPSGLITQAENSLAFNIRLLVQLGS